MNNNSRSVTKNAVTHKSATTAKKEATTHAPVCDKRLYPEESGFLLTFIKCRGSIKDVERELGVSYPTVRAMLDNLITALDREEDAPAEHREAEVTPPISVIDTRATACTTKPVKPRKKANATDARRVILERLAAHEITAEEAAALLKNL